MAEEQADNAVNPVELATELTVAWLGNPNVDTTADQVPVFLKTVHATIVALSKGGDAASADAASEYAPAVPVRSSVKPDYIVSLITGQKLKSLKRHLASHGLTPDEYRARYGLKPDYPMVTANYSAQRREVAQKLGLGRKSRAAASESMPAVAPRPALVKPAAKPKAASKPGAPKRGRPKKADAPAA